ncbi:MAG: hypothetical protein K2K10_04795, partial [Acetatifactor sp.]|nr:hypothetical protein [Acetatifactor sp.]
MLREPEESGKIQREERAAGETGREGGTEPGSGRSKLLSDVESEKVKLRTLTELKQTTIANELRNSSSISIPADVDPVIKYK